MTTTVHNIIVGKLWVDNHGDMDIKGEAGPARGYVAHLKYLPYAYFSKDTQRKVTGVVNDPKGVVCIHIHQCLASFRPMEFYPVLPSLAVNN